MADNTTIDPMAGGDTIRARDIAGVKSQVFAPEDGTPADGSGSTAVAATSEEVFAANAGRVYLLVQNVSDTNMWVDFGAAAVVGQPSVLLAANGGSIVFDGSFVPTSTVNVVCSASGKAYVAKEA